jgi:hypothetical protein
VGPAAFLGYRTRGRHRRRRERHFISAIVIEVDEVTLPARSGADSAALTIATDEV